MLAAGMVVACVSDKQDSLSPLCNYLLEARYVICSRFQATTAYHCGRLHERCVGGRDSACER